MQPTALGYTLFLVALCLLAVVSMIEAIQQQLVFAITSLSCLAVFTAGFMFVATNYLRISQELLTTSENDRSIDH